MSRQPMPRLLRYSSATYDNLRANPRHQLAQRHALNIYAADAIYSFIPKNACSTLRTSLAVANGCIRDSSDFNWIHQNNDTFAASLADLARAKYTFTVLRCPYARLLSVYLDKFLNRNPVAWRYLDLHRRAIDLEDVTFEFFVRSMRSERIRHGDIHWMPQASFLVYEDYDDWFAFEQLPAMVAELRSKIGFEVVDARPLTRHGRDHFRSVRRKEAYRVAPFELLRLKLQGGLPTARSMYSDEMAGWVRRAYREDIALYRKRLDPDQLMFT